MDIKNLTELQKTNRMLVFTVKGLDEITGSIERIDSTAKTVTIRTDGGRIMVIEAADIARVKPVLIK